LDAENIDSTRAAQGTQVHIDKDELSRRLESELSAVDNVVQLALQLSGTAAKEQVRKAHSLQRARVLSEAKSFILEKEDVLLEHFANGDDINPNEIDPFIIPVHTKAEADLFRYASLTWSVPVSAGYGRRTRFLVKDRQNNKLVGIFALGDPVIGLAARDNLIGWTTEQRNNRLYNVFDAYILGAVEPYRQLLAGKLTALMTLSNETRNFIFNKYEGNTTEIRKETKDPTPILISTSSSLGRSSIYNRITFNGYKMFYPIGYTSGFGHFHISDELFSDLKLFLDQEAEEDESIQKLKLSSSWGTKGGPNWKFRVLGAAMRKLELGGTDRLKHGLERQVFLAPLATNWAEYLRAEDEQPNLLDIPEREIGEYYKSRWAVGRAQRMPGYKLWDRTDDRLSQLLEKGNRQLSLYESDIPVTGDMAIGPFRIKIGIRQELKRYRPKQGPERMGTVWHSRVVGPGTDVLLSHTTWEDRHGRINIEGAQGTGENHTKQLQKQSMKVTASERFSELVFTELRVPSKSAKTGKVQLRKPSKDHFEKNFTQEIVQALNQFEEMMYGTRKDLLKDQGSTCDRPIALYQWNNQLVPLFIWVITRAIPLYEIFTGDKIVINNLKVNRRPPARKVE